MSNSGIKTCLVAVFSAAIALAGCGEKQTALVINHENELSSSDQEHVEQLLKIEQHWPLLKLLATEFLTDNRFPIATDVGFSSMGISANLKSYPAYENQANGLLSIQPTSNPLIISIIQSYSWQGGGVPYNYFVRKHFVAANTSNVSQVIVASCEDRNEAIPRPCSLKNHTVHQVHESQYAQLQLAAGLIHQ